ncbi:MAG: hypothetical protein Q8O67_09340 [Deltaproteobacteria bacterium]|nr:hypothetical protein [Deltaproteobacteria bacterium]
MKNRWCSYDATDPILIWELAVPAPSPHEQQAVVDAVLTAGRETGVLVTNGLLPIAGLPYEDALFAGEKVPFASRVFVRDSSGSLVERFSDDAGALLKSLEVFDDVYARRFAASHPVVGAFSTATEKAVTVSVCFFASLYFDESDAELHAKNQPRLLGFREQLLQIARARGGKLKAPTTTSTTTTLD